MIVRGGRNNNNIALTKPMVLNILVGFGVGILISSMYWMNSPSSYDCALSLSSFNRVTSSTSTDTNLITDESRQSTSTNARVMEVDLLKNRLINLEAEASKISKYWDMRKGAKLYSDTVEIARKEAPDALTALDVGAYESPYLARFDWIPTKVATDIQARPQVWEEMIGIAFIQGDFLQLKFGSKFDLVLCTQVIEHLPDDVVAPFIEKMTKIGKVVIVSTTYEMPPGTIEGHIQDPISEEKFRSWFPDNTNGNLTQVSILPGHVKLTDPADGIKKQTYNIIGVWRKY